MLVRVKGVAKTAHGVVLPHGHVMVRQTGLMTAQACVEASLRMADDFGPQVRGWVWDYSEVHMKVHPADLPLIEEAVRDVDWLNKPPVALVALRKDFWLTRQYSIQRALAGQLHRSFIAEDEGLVWARRLASALESGTLPESPARATAR